MKKITLLVLILGASRVWSQTSDLKSGNGLKSILELAEKNSPELGLADASYKISELKATNARFQLLPQGSLSLTHGFAKDNTSKATGDNLKSSESKLDLNWALYNNGTNLTANHLAQLRREAEGLSRFITREDFALVLSNTFYDLSLQKVLIDLQKEQVDIYKRQLGLIDKLYRQGLKTEQDYSRFRSDTLQTELDYKIGLQKIESLHFELLRQIGQKEVIDEGLPLLTPEPVERFEPLPDKFDLNSNPILALDQLSSEITKTSVSQARRDVWPQIFLTTGAEYGSRNYWGPPSLSDGKFWSWNTALKLQYNFLDWGEARRNASIIEATSLQEELKIRASAVKLQAMAEDVRNQIKLFKESQSLVQELTRLEDKNFADIEQRYKQGRVSYLDFVDALNKRLAARIQYSTNYFNYLKLQARVWHLQGQLYENIKKM